MSSAGTLSLGGPPAPDELEVLVFGPGIGESILVHVGDGIWLCVDSAKYQKAPWTLRYLEAIGLKPDVLRLIVATHWHSDHVDGISEIVSAAPGAHFVCSRALRVDEFKQLMARYIDDDQDPIRAPLREIRATFETYCDRRKADPNHPAPLLAGDNQRLLQTRLANGSIAEAWSLSPSSDDVLLAMREFAQLFTPLGQQAPAIPPARQNTTAIVLRINVGADQILLGSDLENTNGPNTGWNSVVTGWDILAGPADVFKVAHHGSENAFSQPLWNQRINQNAVAVVTPYTSSGLPRGDQLQRLSMQGRDVYATALPKTATANRNAAVQRMMRIRSRSINTLSSAQFGAVRLRKRLGATSNWNVELFGSAIQI